MFAVVPVVDPVGIETFVPDDGLGPQFWTSQRVSDCSVVHQLL
jgi:hypothetical protein